MAFEIGVQMYQTSTCPVLDANHSALQVGVQVEEPPATSRGAAEALGTNARAAITAMAATAASGRARVCDA